MPRTSSVTTCHCSSGTPLTMCLCRQHTRRSMVPLLRSSSAHQVTNARTCSPVAWLTSVTLGEVLRHILGEGLVHAAVGALGVLRHARLGVKGDAFHLPGVELGAEAQRHEGVGRRQHLLEHVPCLPARRRDRAVREAIQERDADDGLAAQRVQQLVVEELLHRAVLLGGQLLDGVAGERLDERHRPLRRLRGAHEVRQVGQLGRLPRLPLQVARSAGGGPMSCQALLERAAGASHVALTARVLEQVDLAVAVVDHGGGGTRGVEEWGG